MSSFPVASIAPEHVQHRTAAGATGTCQDGVWIDLTNGWVVVVDGGGAEGSGEALTQAILTFFAQRLPHVTAAATEIPPLFIGANQSGRDVVQGEGATASVLVARLEPGSAQLWHVGNVRAYKVAGGRTAPVTKDHTLAALLIERGQMTAEQAQNHPASRSLAKFLGGKREPEPDVTTVALQPGERLLMATQGAFGAVGAANVQAALGRGTLADALDTAWQVPAEDDRTVVLFEETRLPAAPAPSEALVQQLFRIMTGTADPEAVLEQILALSVSLASGDRGFLFLVDETGELDCRVRHGNAGPLAGDTISQSVVKKVCETGTSIWLQDAMNDQVFGQQESIMALKLHTVLCVPFRGVADAAGRVAGVLYVDRTTPMTDETDLRHLEVLAHYAGTLIHNSVLQANLRVQNERLQRLNALGRILSASSDTEGILHDILAYALQVTGSDEAVVLLGQPLQPYYALDRDGSFIDTPQVSQSAVQRVVNELKPIFVLDTSADEQFASQASVMALSLRSVMAVPLFAGGRLEGVLYLSGRVVANRLGKLDLEFLEILSSQASVALTNARHFQRLEEEILELQDRLGLVAP